MRGVCQHGNIYSCNVTSSGVSNIHLNKHVIYDEEEVDDFRRHDKDGKATVRLVKTHTLELAVKLEGSWKKSKASNTAKRPVGSSNRFCGVQRLLTYGCGLQHERDNAEEVDVGVVHSELNKDALGVRVKPRAVIKVLKGPV